MKEKQKNHEFSLKKVAFLYFSLIILLFLSLQIEDNSEIVQGLLLIGIAYPVTVMYKYYRKNFYYVIVDEDGIEYRTLWKRKFISWNDISYIKINLWYSFETHKYASTLIYNKNISNNNPYLSIRDDLIGIPTIEIKEDEKPNSYLRRLLLVKRRKLMVDSKQFKHTRFYKDVQQFAPHLQIEESVAYT